MSAMALARVLVVALPRPLITFTLQSSMTTFVGFLFACALIEI